MTPVLLVVDVQKKFFDISPAIKRSLEDAIENINAAYRGAEDADLKPVILTGAMASGNPDHIKMVENITDVISLGALKKVIS